MASRPLPAGERRKRLLQHAGDALGIESLLQARPSGDRQLRADAVRCLRAVAMLLSTKLEATASRATDPDWLGERIFAESCQRVPSPLGDSSAATSVRRSSRKLSSAPPSQLVTGRRARRKVLCHCLFFELYPTAKLLTAVCNYRPTRLILHPKDTSAAKTILATNWLRNWLGRGRETCDGSAKQLDFSHRPSRSAKGGLA